MSQRTVMTYDTPWSANAMSWSNQEGAFRIGIGSFVKKYSNFVEVVELDPETDALVLRATVEHSYPPTKLLFAPSNFGRQHDSFITTGDYIRFWTMQPKPESELHPASEGSEAAGSAAARTVTHSLSFRTLNSNKHSEFCSPLTSCDWNTEEPNIVAACSIDTTVSVWDLEKEANVMQLIAHDKEVFDVAFAKTKHIFATCGADGSLRVFDTREMEHCTIVFEAPDNKSLLRCSWNKLDGTYISTFTIDGSQVYLVDVRFPSIPVGTLEAHTAPVNSMMWAPTTGNHLCTGGEDRTALIWDLADLPNSQPQVQFSYSGAPGEINTIGWSMPRGGDNWIALTAGNQLQVLKV